MTQTRILEVVEEVEFSYPADEQVGYVIPAGLTLSSDEAWCLRGTSGGGKSTLLSLLAALRQAHRGLIRYTFPQATPVEVSRDSWRNVAGPALWHRVGFAFQRPELIRALDVRDNLQLALGSGTPPCFSLFETEEWNRIARSNVWQISGGQIQRLGLMRAFGAHQPLIFLDEPTNNLDRRNRAAAAELIRKNRSGRALVVVSHDEEFLESLGFDRVFEVHDRGATGGRLWRALVETT